LLGCSGAPTAVSPPISTASARADARPPPLVCTDDDAKGCVAVGQKRLAKDDRAGAFAAFTTACDRAHDVDGCVYVVALKASATGKEQMLARAPIINYGCAQRDQRACAERAQIALFASEELGTREILRLCEDESMILVCVEGARAFSRAPSADRAIVERLFLRACDAGDSDACMELARRFPGSATPPVATLTTKADCARGDPSACADIASNEAIAALNGTARERSHAENGIAKGCATGHAWSCYLVALYKQYEVAQRPGLMIIGPALGGYDPGVPPPYGEPDEFVPLYEQACELGSSLACIAGARIYEAGLHRPQSDARAVELFRKACHLHHASACLESVQEPERARVRREAKRLVP
jgi:hypothetical protein